METVAVVVTIQEKISKSSNLTVDAVLETSDTHCAKEPSFA